MNGDLSNIAAETTDREISKMITHLRAKEVNANKAKSNAYMNGFGKLLLLGNFMISLGKHVNKIWAGAM